MGDVRISAKGGFVDALPPAYAPMKTFDLPESFDMITGTDNPDFLEGTFGDDIIDALGGNDVIFASGGADIVNGGAGSDDFRINISNSELFPTQNMSRSYSISDAGVFESHGAINTMFIESDPGVSSVEFVAINTTGSGGFDDSFDASQFFSGLGVTFRIEGGSTSITGSDANDVVNFRGGSSVVDLGKGTGDEVRIGFASNLTENITVTENGSGGISVVSDRGGSFSVSNTELLETFAQESTTINVDASNLQSGSPTRFQFSGGDGNDTFAGTQGSDLIFFTGGNDTYSGNDGPDFYILSSFIPDDAFDGDTITDIGPDDQLLYSLLPSPSIVFIGQDNFSGSAVELRYQIEGGNTLIELDNDFDLDADATLTLVGRFDAVSSGLATLKFVEAPPPNQITGTDDPDSLAGTLGDDIIDALGGDDDIAGSDGTDVVDGGVGTNDRLNFLTFQDQQFSQITMGRNITVTDTTVVGANSNINTQYSNVEFLTVFVGEFVPGQGLVDTKDDIIDASATTTGFTNFLVRGGNDTLIGGSGINRFSTRVNDDIRSNVFIDGGAGEDISSLGTRNVNFEVTLTAVIDAGDTLVTSNLGDTYRFRSIEEFFLFEGTGGGFLPATTYDFAVASQTIIVDFADAAIAGTTRNVTILSGSGNDEISLGLGNDTASGGLGDDIIDGGDGIDTLDYTNSISSITVDLNVTTAQDTGEGMDTITNFERIIGSDFDDVLTGFNSGFSFLSGRGGDDVINGSTAGEQIFGGDGDDELFGNSGNNLLLGEAGDDILHSGDEDDFLSGGAGTDRASFVESGAAVTVNLNIQRIVQNTSDGLDTLDSIEGLIGSNFNDTLRGNLGANQIDGGDGDDTVFAGRGFDTLNGGDGKDNLQGQIGNDIINGGGGDDFLYGGDGIDTINGGADNDVIRGQNQGDTLNGNGGNDLIFGGEGQDTINGGDGNDGLYGEQRVDWLNGDAGNDYLSGGAATDFLDGGDGFDRIDGGAGRDILTGGAGGDRFFFDDGDFLGLAITTADRITDFSQLQGDVIDLGTVDAIGGGGDDGFTFVGTDAFSGTAGELRYQFVSGQTLIRGDTDGDGAADIAIRLDGQIQLVEADFAL